jgi:LuxR family transcriptional regulator, maltose regulon positive regulatory protein
MSQLAVAPTAWRRSAIDGTALHLAAPDAISPGEGIVWRTGLVNRLRAARAPVATLVAPTGYGKTTLLEQWAERDERHFIWLFLDPGDDPAAPLSQIEAALESTQGSKHAVRSEPVVVVVDDAHLLGTGARAGLAELLRRARGGAMVVLAGRTEPRLPQLSVPRLRASGELLELGPTDLALTRREIQTMARALGVTLTEAQLVELVEETEGWPAALRLTMSSCGYESLQSTCLAGLTPTQRTFVRRTSVLDRLSPPLCDAVLGYEPGEREPESSNDLGAFLVPLDRYRQWFRYRPILSSRLRRELEATEPELVPVLHKRAAVWYQEHGDYASALAHAHAAGDLARYMAIFARAALPAHDRGHDAVVESWLRCVGTTDVLEYYPEAATLAARLHAHHGRGPEAARCLRAAQRGLARVTSNTSDRATIQARARLVRAAAAAKRPRTMLVGAQAALEQLAPTDRWYAYGLLLEGVAYALLGEETRADGVLDQAAEAAERLGANETLALALTERSLLADARGDHAGAEAFLAGAQRFDNRLERLPSHALTLAVSARIALRNGDWSEARRSIAAGQHLLPGLTEALPWLAVQTRLELAGAHVMLRDAAAARLLLLAIDRLLGARPEVGILNRQRMHLEAELATMPAGPDGSPVRLTAAELRLLPLLRTHLSFREIGSHFYLSRHTVKTQAISAYRKLGASSRGEAVQEAEKLGLIDTAPAMSTSAMTRP